MVDEQLAEVEGVGGDEVGEGQPDDALAAGRARAAQHVGKLAIADIELDEQMLSTAASNLHKTLGFAKINEIVLQKSETTTCKITLHSSTSLAVERERDTLNDPRSEATQEQPIDRSLPWSLMLRKEHWLHFLEFTLCAGIFHGHGLNKTWHSLKYKDNSVQAIKEALFRGYDGVEIDIQLCDTGEIVVFHDTYVDDHFLSDMTAEQLKQKDIHH